MPVDVCPTKLCLMERRAVEGREALFERPDGTRIPIIPYPVPLTDEEGEVVGVVSMKLDISERKKAELALAERNIQLALAGQAALVGSFAYDTDTEIMQVSEGYAAIHGFPEGTVEKARSECLADVHPDDIGQVTQLRSEAFHGRRREYSVEYRIIRAGGEVRWVETRCFISYDGEGRSHRVVGVSIDITERKKAELALAERDALIGLAEKVTRVGNYAVDINTGRVQLSAGCVAIHGFPEGTAEVRRDDWRASVHPDDLARLDRLFSQAFAERWPEYKADYRIIRSGGEVRWIEARAVIAYDRNGRPERLVGVNIDVTERKRVEEQQRTLLAELDHRVKNALATVSAVVSHTRQGTRSVADFVAALDGRIRSMATTHKLLSSRRWHGVSLTELVRREFAPYATRNNTKIGGPEVTLTAEAVQVVSMVLHELTTNAAKHGALSVHDGRVSVHWHGASNGNVDAPIALDWQEAGGPAVQIPDTCGYGMEVIRDLIPYELGGRVDLSFPADGLCCRLEIPAEWLSNGTRTCGTVNGAGQPLHGVS